MSAMLDGRFLCLTNADVVRAHATVATSDAGEELDLNEVRALPMKNPNLCRRMRGAPAWTLGLPGGHRSLRMS